MNPQAGYKTYKIICLGCKGHSIVRIMDITNQVIYVQHTPIIACRLRPDMKWGFECTCGNDSRLAKEEIGQVNMLVSGGGVSVIDRIVKMAKIKDSLKFRMEFA